MRANVLLAMGFHLALVLSVGLLAYSCPITISCPIDGEAMFQEGCDYNTQTRHTVCRYGHDHYENGTKVHHYNYVDCG